MNPEKIPMKPIISSYKFSTGFRKSFPCEPAETKASNCLVPASVCAASESLVYGFRV